MTLVLSIAANLLALLFEVLLHLLPIAIIYDLRSRGKNLSGELRSALYCFAVTFGLIFYSLSFYELYLGFRLDQFDFNGDGIFSFEEQTPEQEEAMNRVIWDTGRNLAYLAGSIFSVGLGVTVYLVCKIYYYVQQDT